MFTFLALIVVLLMMALITLAVITVGGSVFIMLFGDLIVCVLIIIWLIKKIFKKKGK